MRSRREAGFTLVELLMVVLIVGLLMTIVIPLYNEQRQLAYITKQISLVHQLELAITTARISEDRTLREITGVNWTADPCINSNPSSTYPANLPKTHACWTGYLQALDRIAAASGENLDALRNGDVNGAPLVIDENEGERPETPCWDRDYVGYYVGGKTPGADRGAPYFTNVDDVHTTPVPKRSHYMNYHVTRC